MHNAAVQQPLTMVSTNSNPTTVILQAGAGSSVAMMFHSVVHFRRSSHHWHHKGLWFSSQRRPSQPDLPYSFTSGYPGQYFRRFVTKYHILAASVMMATIQAFLKQKDPNYKALVAELLQNYKILVCNMSVKVHSPLHLDYFPENLGAVSEEQGEGFHQDIKKKWSADTKVVGIST
ncbi:hypothetical protein TNCV_4086481 [Trichonephila clavipes]|nr:hypothetical protein TNCV_4086481 [Trichonephila clavipes]